MEVRKLPVGIQAFEGFRSDGYLYVDKTEYIYQLIGSGKVYFLSRPRRFGKSLLLSTIRAFWEGKKELFHGLAIEGLVKEDGWYAHPVFAFDFNGYSYQNKGDLETALDNQLKRWEHVYMPTGNLPPEDYSKGNLSVESRLAENLPSLSVRFRNLLEAASEHTGRRCVVLVDEYDKSLLETIDQPELCEHNRMVFKSFFSVLKSCDEFLRFVFITGVTKFSKVSIFSDLNQLNDISLNETFSAICGITEREIREYFQPETEALAARQHMTAEECMQALRDRYDGYRFCPGAEGVYNPFSILKAFYEKDFGSYWFETGTPTFLVKLIRKNGADVRKISNGTLYATRAGLTDYRADSIDLVPLLY